MELDKEVYGENNDKPYRFTGLQQLSIYHGEGKEAAYSWEWNSVDGLSVYGSTGKKLKRIPQDVTTEINKILPGFFDKKTYSNIDDYPIWVNATAKTKAVTFDINGEGWYMTAMDILLYRPGDFVLLKRQQSIFPDVKVPMRWGIPIFIVRKKEENKSE